MDEILTLKEAAQMLRIHWSTAYRLVKRGEIPAFRIGSDYRLSRQQLETWMKERTNASTQIS